jgi:hypothetical protein
VGADGRNGSLSRIEVGIAENNVSLKGLVTCPPNGVDVYARFNGSGAVYEDNVQSCSTVEPAIDLTASSLLAFAWAIAGAPSGTP